MKHDRKRIAAALTAVLVLAAVLRLYQLGATSFWLDEVFSFDRALLPPGTIIWEKWFAAAGTDAQIREPLHFLLVHPLLDLTRSEFWVRLPSVVFSLLDIVVVFLLGRELFDDRVGLVAALLLAISPLHVRYAQEFRWYATWSFFSALGYLALVRAWRAEGLRAWISYGGATVLSVLTFVLAWSVVAMQIASTSWLSLEDRSPKRLLACLAALLAVGVLTYPSVAALLPLADPAGEVVGTPRPNPLAAIPYSYFAYFAGYSAGPSVAELHSLPSVSWIVTNYPSTLLYGVVFLLVAGAGLREAWDNAEARSVLIPWAIGLPSLLFAMAVWTNDTYNVRYALSSLSPVILLFAAGAFRWRRWLGSRGWLALGGVLLLMLSSLSNYYWDDRYERSDVRAAVQQIESVGDGRGLVAVAGQVLPVVEFYLDDTSTEAVRVYRCEARTTEVTVKTQSGIRSLARSRLWLLVSRDWEGVGERCREAMKGRYDLVTTAHFPGVDVYRFGRSDG